MDCASIFGIFSLLATRCSIGTPDRVVDLAGTLNFTNGCVLSPVFAGLKSNRVVQLSLVTPLPGMPMLLHEDQWALPGS